MPREDGTGPAGLGLMTGRGAGCCTENETSDLLKQVFAERGRGRRRGHGGHGRRNRLSATGPTGWQCAGIGAEGLEPLSQELPVESRERQLELLNSQREHLEGVIDAVSKRIEALEAKAES